VQTEGHQGPSDWCGAVAERTKGQGVGGRSHKGLVRGGDSCLRDKRVNISKEENEGGRALLWFQRKFIVMATSTMNLH
jgi:hypothetical protein